MTGKEDIVTTRQDKDVTDTRNQNRGITLTKVIIAHRKNDKESAGKLQEELQESAPEGGVATFDLLQIKNRSDSWNADHPKKIDEAHLLIYFLPDAEFSPIDKEWVSFEAGGAHHSYFSNKDFPIILLYNKEITLPEPIALDYTTKYSSEESQIIKFIQYFYGNSKFPQHGIPLNEHVSKKTEKCEGLAKKIKKLFHPLDPNRVPRIVQNEQPTLSLFMWLKFKKDSHKGVPDYTQIESNHHTLATLFNQQERATLTWGDIVQSWERRIADNNNKQVSGENWIKDLKEAIIETREGAIVDTIKSRFRCNSKIYRPIIFKFERYDDNSEKIKIIFVTESSEPWTPKAPKPELTTLLSNLNMAARLQWEVCDEFLPQLDNQSGTEEVDLSLLDSIKQSYQNIEEDGKFREKNEAVGIANQERLAAAFLLEEKEEIKNNLKEQEKIKDTLRGKNNNCTLKDIKDALDELKRLNAVVMLKAARRFTEALTEIYPEQ